MPQSVISSSLFHILYNINTNAIIISLHCTNKRVGQQLFVGATFVIYDVTKLQSVYRGGDNTHSMHLGMCDVTTTSHHKLKLDC